MPSALIIKQLILLNMKRMIFLMLMLGMLSAASMNAQVTIGSMADPHAGAVLDLSTASNRGFLLPQVSLTGITDWSPLGGTSAGGVGMVVYNVNEAVGNGAGVYVWSGPGDGWISLKSNFASAVKVTGFTLDPSTTPVEIWAGGSRNFSVSNFQPSTATYQGVTWQITTGDAYAEVTDMTSISCRVNGLAAGTATLRVAGIDDYFSKNITIQVNPVTVQSFLLDKSSLTLDVGSKTGTITADNFVGSNGLTLSGVTVNWSIYGENTTGSTIASDGNTCTVTSGTATGTFTVRASVGSITQDCEVTIDDCFVKDAEGNSYVAAKFGAAGCWMTQNLRSTRNDVYTDLTANRNAGTNASLKYYWYPNNSQATFNAHPEYGLLYTWAAATGRTSSANEANTAHTQYQGICPTGWHLPSDYEWNQLEEVIAKDATNAYSTTGATTWETSYSTATSYRGAHGQKMKSTTIVSGSTNGTSNARNANGFDALLVGGMSSGSLANYGTYAYFCSSSSNDSTNAWYRYLYSSNTGMNRYSNDKYNMRSVRCKKNDN
jgi:uncharacterized protein (TIGR02145 family)